MIIVQSSKIVMLHMRHSTWTPAGGDMCHVTPWQISNFQCLFSLFTMKSLKFCCFDPKPADAFFMEFFVLPPSIPLFAGLATGLVSYSSFL